MPYFYFAGGVTRGRPHRAPSSCEQLSLDVRKVCEANVEYVAEVAGPLHRKPTSCLEALLAKPSEMFGIRHPSPSVAVSTLRVVVRCIVHCLTIGPAVLFDSASLLWPLSLAPGPSAEPKPAPKKQFVGLWLADVGRKPSVEPKTGFQNKYGISGWRTLAVSKAVNQKPPPTIEFGVSGWLILAVSQAK